MSQDRTKFLVTYFFEDALVLKHTQQLEIEGRRVVAIQVEIEAWSVLGASSTAISRVRDAGVGAPSEDGGIDLYPYSRLLKLHVIEREK